MHVVLKACSLILPKPTGVSQVFPLQLPIKLLDQQTSFFRHKTFFPPLSAGVCVYVFGYYKGIQMLRFICLLERYAYH